MNYEEAKNYLYHGDGTTPKENPEMSDKFDELYMCVTDDKISEGIQFIKEMTSCDNVTAELLWADLKRDFGSKENNPILQAREKYEKEKIIQDYQYRNNAECPYCHSKNTKKISTVSKAIHTAFFGVFSMSRNAKQWHCNNCNSDF